MSQIIGLLAAMAVLLLLHLPKLMARSSGSALLPVRNSNTNRLRKSSRVRSKVNRESIPSSKSILVRLAY
jgi:hypothetical protein